MAFPAPTEPAVPPRYTVERYLALVSEGVLTEDDRVELLEGVVVAMPPSNPPHATGVGLAYAALTPAVGTRAAIRVQSPLRVGTHSMPEPDVAVVAGSLRDYGSAHPTTALLVIEVSDTSLAQDRLTKAAIYAAAEIPEYWLVNLRARRVEVFRRPDPQAGRYAEVTLAAPGTRLEILALPGASVAVDDLLPDA